MVEHIVLEICVSVVVSVGFVSMAASSVAKVRSSTEIQKERIRLTSERADRMAILRFNRELQERDEEKQKALEKPHGRRSKQSYSDK